jgi:16S rRNA (uracil1498-N3)-methyltransferase
VSRPPLTHAPHVFVDDLDTLQLDQADHHHLRVLRIATGASIVACDGSGMWRLCRRRDDGLDADGPIAQVGTPSPKLAIAFALTKGDKPELVVQKLTELGIDRIVPFVAERSVVRWDDARARRNLDRWRRVAREAAMQSRRVTIPMISEVTSVRSLGDEGFGRADRDGAPLTLACPAVAVGPEGGFTDRERAVLAQSVTLAGTVLRAETAAIAAAAVLAALRDQTGAR